MNIYGANNFIGNHSVLRVSCDRDIRVWGDRCNENILFIFL